MDYKIINNGENVQDKIISGVTKAADAIKTTLGPQGRGVAITTQFGIDITRDGATVAKSIALKDPVENIGADLVKKAASLTEDKAGDGTSSTSIMIKEFCKKGQKAISTGSNVNEIKSGMLAAEKWIKEFIKNNSIEIDGDLEKIRKVATISANNDPEVGNLVVQGMKEVGINGLITVEPSSSLDTTITVTTGMKLDRGWAAPQYINSPEDGKCVLEDPYVLVTSERLSSVSQIIPLLEQYQNPQYSQGRPILIVCDDVDDVVNLTFITNCMRGALRCCIVKGLDFGDARKNIMEDIATVVGADHICAESGIKLTDATLSNLGRAKKVVVSRDSTIIYEGMGDPDAIKDRAAVVKARLNDPETSDYDKTKFSKRLANLTGGVAVIKAGGASEAETQNRKATIEDSVLAASSAIEEGCVPGGGYMFYRASKEIMKDSKFWKGLTEDEKEGAMIVVKSLPVILTTIAENAGMSGEVILNEVGKLKKPNFGFNAKTKKFEDLVESGVLDSSKALRVCLENSISTASMILLIDCTITDPEPKDEWIGRAHV